MNYLLGNYTKEVAYIVYLMIWLFIFIFQKKLYKNINRLFIIIIYTILFPIILFGGLIFGFSYFDVVPNSYKLIYITGVLLVFILFLCMICFMVYNGLALSLSKEYKISENQILLNYKHFFSWFFIISSIFIMVFLGFTLLLHWLYIAGYFFLLICGFFLILYKGIELYDFFGIHKIDVFKKYINKQIRRKKINFPFKKYKDR